MAQCRGNPSLGRVGLTITDPALRQRDRLRRPPRLSGESEGADSICYFAVNEYPSAHLSLVALPILPSAPNPSGRWRGSRPLGRGVARGGCCSQPPSPTELTPIWRRAWGGVQTSCKSQRQRKTTDIHAPNPLASGRKLSVVDRSLPTTFYLTHSAVAEPRLWRRRQWDTRL